MKKQHDSDLKLAKASNAAVELKRRRVEELFQKNQSVKEGVNQNRHQLFKTDTRKNKQLEIATIFTSERLQMKKRTEEQELMERKKLKNIQWMGKIDETKNRHDEFIY